MPSRLLLSFIFLAAGSISQAQADSLALQQKRDSLVIAQKKIIAEIEQQQKEARLGTNNLSYKEQKSLPFSYPGKKSHTSSLTTFYYTNYFCLSGDGRFRLVCFHEGPTTLTEGTYTQQGDSLLLQSNTRPTEEFISSYQLYSNWRYLYFPYPVMIYHIPSRTLQKTD